MAYPELLRKPLHVPSAQTLDIFDDDLETRKVHGGDSVECDVEEDEGPFEEGVDSVCLEYISGAPLTKFT